MMPATFVTSWWRSGRAVALASHLDHRAAESRAREQALRRLVPFRGLKHDTRRATIRQRRECGIEQHSAHAVSAVRRIHDDVVQRARGCTQRHVVEALESRIAVAEHLAVTLGDEHDDVGYFELRAEE